MRINSEFISDSLVDKKMSRSELARSCEMSISQLSTILRRGTATEATAGKIASALGVSAKDIRQEASQ